MTLIDSPAPPRIEPADARHRPRPGRWIAAVVILVLVAMVIKGAAVNANMHWRVVGEYIFSIPVLQGLLLTVELTAVAMVIGIALGLLIAVMRLSDIPILRTVSYAYVWIFRGIPLLVQLLFWYFLAAVLPHVGIGIPFGPTWVEWSVNSLISRFTAATLGLALNEAAFSSEIIRGGIQSVDRGQWETADALGLNGWQRLWRIVLPQAMNFIIPPLGNQIISMLKNTSLVLVIALPELLTTVSNIYSQNFLQIPLLVVACAWYLACFSVLCVVQYYIERHFSQSSADAPRTRRRGFARTGLMSLTSRPAAGKGGS